ncbi:MAG: sigma-70 family RNA polymerase sigma factor [Myxococcota bacterium]
MRRERYTELLREHGRGLTQVVGSYARRAEDREDLVQDLALALWNALPNYRVEASLKVFAYRIATNLAISHLRRRRRVVPERETVDEAPSPEAALDEADRRRALRGAIDALPLSLRQVVVLRLEGLRYVEIGDVLGISEKNVSVRLTRARQHLRDHIGVPPS